MEPGVESLNAALVTGIALYLWRRGQGSENDQGSE
jgi:tRNA G18 (ribose-2'-O)-methylase SpoU